MMAIPTLIERVLSPRPRPDATVACPTCGARLAVGARRCPRSGNEVLTECRNCGYTIETRTPTCPACGGSEYETFQFG